MILFIGVILFAWHLKFPDDIQRYIFFPWIGALLIVIGVMRTLKKAEKIELGDKKVWIPLAVISVSIALSGVMALIERRWNIQDTFSAITIGVLTFTIYLASKQIGIQLFRYMPLVVVIESISIPIVAAFNNWHPNGGLYSWTNYDISTGLVIFGILVSPKKSWWWLSIIGSIGLLFSGSGEAMVSGGILLGVAWLSKVKWYQWALPIASVVLVSAIIIPLGIFQSVQAPNMQRLATIGIAWNLPPNQSLWVEEKSKADSIVVTPPESKVIDEVLGYRITHFQISPIKIFGYGININRFYWGIPHNIILIIIEQVGILAMLAWVYLAFLGIKNKSTRVMWIGFVSLGLLDHYIFTQAFVWFPCLLGAYSITNNGRVNNEV